LRSDEQPILSWLRSQAGQGATGFLIRGGRGAAALARTLVSCGESLPDLSYPLVLSLQNSIANALEDAELSASGILDGSMIGAFAYSERRDALEFETRLRCEADGWLVLSGQKSWVTVGALADLYFVYAETETRKLQVVLVRRSDAGVVVEPLEGHGLAAAAFARVSFHDVRLPPDRIIEENDGLSHAQWFLNNRRLLLCCGTVGRMRAILDHCGRYALVTERYHRRLAEYPNVQVIIGRMRVLLNAAQSTLDCAIAALESNASNRDRYWDSHQAAAKVFVVDTAQQFALLALRVLGGSGFRAESEAARFQRDCTGLIAGGGPQDLLENLLGAEWLQCMEEGVRS
jgi:alkylation response protein AidB-like acyl-CoA dehydrogenase